MILHRKMSKSWCGGTVISGWLIMCCLLCSLQLMESSGLNGTSEVDPKQRKRAIDFPTLFYPGPDRKYITMAPPVKLSPDLLKTKTKPQQEKSAVAAKPTHEGTTLPPTRENGIDSRIPSTESSPFNQGKQKTFAKQKQPEIRQFSAHVFPPSPPAREQNQNGHHSKNQLQLDRPFPTRAQFKPDVADGARDPPPQSRFRPASPETDVRQNLPKQSNREFSNPDSDSFVLPNNPTDFNRISSERNGPNVKQGIEHHNNFPRKLEPLDGNRQTQFMRPQPKPDVESHFERHRPADKRPNSNAKFWQDQSFPVESGQRQALPFVAPEGAPRVRSQEKFRPQFSSAFKTSSKQSLFKSIVTDPNRDHISNVNWPKIVQFQPNAKFVDRPFSQKSQKSSFFESWPTGTSKGSFNNNREFNRQRVQNRQPATNPTEGFSRALNRLTSITSPGHNDAGPYQPRQKSLAMQPPTNQMNRQPFFPPSNSLTQQSNRDQSEQDRFRPSTGMPAQLDDQRRPTGADHNLPAQHAFADGAMSRSTFSCRHQLPGYYADIESGCLIFHICHSNRQYTFMCPDGTLFSQTLLVCDWAQRIRCSVDSETNFDNNRLH